MVATATCLVAFALSACDPASGDPAATPSGTPSSATAPPPSPTPSRPDEPVRIADGVSLEPGADGTLPVSVRWVQELAVTEAIAVDGNVVYAADEVIKAFRITDGEPLWEVGDPEGYMLETNGGVSIGPDGSDRVRVFAPWNYDLVADRRTGRLIRLGLTPGGDPPPNLRPFPAPAPALYDVDVDDAVDQITARRPDGAVAWRITIDGPMFDHAPAIRIPGGLVLATGSGHLVALDYR